MMTAALTMIVLWCLFYGQLQAVWLGGICLVSGVSLAVITRHKHTGFLTIDVLAQTSRLKTVNAGLKFWVAILLLFICVASQNPNCGLFLSLCIPIFTVGIGGLRFGEYMRLLALPVSFLLLSGLALLFEVATQPGHLFSIKVFGFWLNVSDTTQSRTILVMARALGAVSCLYFLSLTTPMSDIIGVLRRAHCPNLLIELMYLIYRYIFILLSMFYTMKEAATSRLGYSNYQRSIRTTGYLYANLLAGSYRKASKNFDAMESRCYDTKIQFLQTTYKVTKKQMLVTIMVILITLAFWIG